MTPIRPAATADTALEPAACRAARALVGVSTGDLEALSGVSARLIKRFETGETLRDSDRAALRKALEACGVEILDGEAAGARLRRGNFHSELKG